MKPSALDAHYTFARDTGGIQLNDNLGGSERYTLPRYTHIW